MVWCVVVLRCCVDVVYTTVYALVIYSYVVMELLVHGIKS